ncbi:MAG: LysR family transcriptional regulator [Desulfovibrio sp.]|uniref:LysR family transcriptional regulator n=1 Tax=Desulfovibrio sp. TaxID=885 RepID=UPI00135DD08E|nr:LysR family transcriptional regulator [Desulfovibrio sp.]MTJ91978.1 LysR family transcriptional regulator [Desulfovibrio sp.]
MTLKQLQVFIAVARYENLGQAADALFLTKGAVSQALQELERHLGVRLFDRVHPHLRLNHEGAQLRPLADEMLQRAEAMERLFQAGGACFLNVGASKTIGNYLLPQLLCDFEKQNAWLPKAQIANTARLLELVETYTLDVVLLEGEQHLPQMESVQWLQDEMAVVACRGHSLADGKAHAPEELAGQRWILREPNSGTRAYFEHTLGALIAPYNVALSLSSTEGVLGMVERGMGITFASRLMAELPGFSSRFSIIRLNRQFSRTFTICWHQSKYHSAGMDSFIRFCRAWSPARK